MEITEDLLKSLVDFEDSIYGERVGFYDVGMIDASFYANRLVRNVTFRPFQLEKVVEICYKFSNDALFKGKTINEAFLVCPVLVYRLFLLGVYTIKEIEIHLNRPHKFTTCFYFRNYIRDYERYLENTELPDGFDSRDYIDVEKIDLMIQYGFVPSSIEFSMKYDDLQGLLGHFCGIHVDSKVCWSPFEWSREPKSFEYLSFCGLFGSLKCFKYLLMNGYSVNNDVLCSVVFGGSTDLLHLSMNESNMGICFLAAAEYCRLSIMKFLLEQGVYIDEKDEYSDTALHYASRHGHISIVEYLVGEGADINAKNLQLWTPIHNASRNGFFHMVQYFISHKVDIFCMEHRKWTPLHCATKNGDLCTVRTIVQNGADINAKNAMDDTPLSLSVMNGHAEVVEYLLTMNVDVNTKDVEFHTPLHEAVLIGNLQIVKMLILKNASINAKTKQSMAPIHFAVSKGFFQIVQLLVKRGASIDIKDGHFDTPIHIAAKYGYSNIIEYLLYMKANIESKALRGYTPLHYAAKNGHLKSIEVLVLNGADLNAKNKDGDTPIQIASKNGHYQIIEYLNNSQVYHINGL